MVAFGDGTLMNGISAFIKEALQNSLTPSTMQGHREKMAIYEPGNRLSPDTKSANAVALDF